PTIMEYGTPEQKSFFLPRILAGECHFSIGYSEPGAGTDLAALRTRAVRDGDHYVVTGNKVFTSLAEYADYIWLAARTDPTAPKHKGISMLIVNTRLPGYKCTPIWTMAGVRTNATYYEDVRVPTSSLVGRENEGWWLITSQLNRERIALSPVGPLKRMLGDVRRWAEETRLADGRRVIDQEWVRVKLARVRARWEALKLLVWRQAWCMTQGSLNFADASAVKVYASEFYIEAYRDLMEVVGQRGYLKDGSPEAVLGGRLEFIYRASSILTFGGGTTEIQRDILAMAGLKSAAAVRGGSSDGLRIQRGAGSPPRAGAEDPRRPHGARSAEGDREGPRLVRPRALDGARKGEPPRRGPAGHRGWERPRVPRALRAPRGGGTRGRARSGVADAPSRRPARQPVRHAGAARATPAQGRERRGDSPCRAPGGPLRGPDGARDDRPRRGPRLATRRRQGVRPGRASRRPHPRSRPD